MILSLAYCLQVFHGEQHARPLYLDSIFFPCFCGCVVFFSCCLGPAQVHAATRKWNSVRSLSSTLLLLDGAPKRNPSMAPRRSIGPSDFPVVFCQGRTDAVLRKFGMQQTDTSAAAEDGQVYSGVRYQLSDGSIFCKADAYACSTYMPLVYMATMRKVQIWISATWTAWRVVNTSSTVGDLKESLLSTLGSSYKFKVRVQDFRLLPAEGGKVGDDCRVYYAKSKKYSLEWLRKP